MEFELKVIIPSKTNWDIYECIMAKNVKAMPRIIDSLDKLEREWQAFEMIRTFSERTIKTK